MAWGMVQSCFFCTVNVTEYFLEELSEEGIGERFKGLVGVIIAAGEMPIGVSILDQTYQFAFKTEAECDHLLKSLAGARTEALTQLKEKMDRIDILEILKDI